MTRPEPSILAALAPVRDALLAAARADAERLDARSRRDAERVVAQANEQADRILTDARAAGAADAAEVVARERAQARRRGRAVVLRARREAYEELVAQARTAVVRLRDEPDYAELYERLADAARRLLGPDARIGEASGGGVIAQAGGRHVDLSLTGFADRAVREVAALEAGAQEGPAGGEPRGVREVVTREAPPVAEREAP